MNSIRSYKTVEARSLAALQFKVASRKATGWVVDGPMLQVTDFSHGHRAVHRYSQAMFKADLTMVRWSLL